MPDQINIANFRHGTVNNRTAFNVDNDAFPFMFNFYCWRGRAKRKRGTTPLGRLQRQIDMVSASPPTHDWQFTGPSLSSGNGNLLVSPLGLNPSPNVITGITNATQAIVTVVGHNFQVGEVVQIINVTGMTQINGLYGEIVSSATNTITVNINSSSFSAYVSGGLAYLAGQSQISPGTLTLVVGSNTYTEPMAPNGTLVGTPSGTGTINYTTGAISITGGGSSQVTGAFSYFPGLPVMALPDLDIPNPNSTFPLTMGFDTEYSYQINQTTQPPFFYNVNYYKDTNTPFLWSGADFQQFWTTNYSGALWATNNTPGFNFVNGTYVSGSGTTSITFTFLSGGLPYQNLIVGDMLWFNEWTSGGSTINDLVGNVSTIVNASLGEYIVTFTASETVGGSGIAQLLTNTIPGQDGIKWYDGDPTGGTGLPTGTGLGWVNFAPPLTASTVSINNTPSGLYYLVGCLAILPFKDYLLTFSPWIQTSGGVPIQLIDTVLWSWNGTPYYNSLIPGGQTFNAIAWYQDQTGAGGYLPAGIAQPIATISNNEDALLIGFGGDGRKTRFTFTGNGLQPFLFYTINSELPSTATFSAVALDRGAIDMGTYGLAMTDQQSSQRVDLDIPDEIFQVQTNNNGMQRVNSLRDFKNEWIYFTYPVNIDEVPIKFPSQTFLYNYRDNTWAILYENYTAHGYYRGQSLYSWANIPYPSWETWNEPWDAGITSDLVPQTIAGNPEGWVLIVGEGTGETPSGTISAISNFNGFTQITAINHCVNNANPYTNDGDFLLILNCLGTTSLNGNVGKVVTVLDINNFVIDLPFPTGTYDGLGTFTRLSQPILLTKQFNPYWDNGRKVRLAVQKYLFDTTSRGQVTVHLYLSQDDSNPYNGGSIVPDTSDLQNSGLVYSQLISTSPELYQNICFNQTIATINGVLTFGFNYQSLFDFTTAMVPGTIFIQVGNVATFQDDGNGNLIATGTGVSSGSFVIYENGIVTINFSVAPVNQLTISNFNYFVNDIQNPTEQTQQQAWHRYSTSLIGDSVQVGFTLQDSQMRDISFATAEIALHAINLIVERGPLLA